MAKINRQKVYEKCGGHCAYCGRVIDYKDMQVDHLFPKRDEYIHIAYGNGTSIDDISNLMPSCRVCNHYKRAHTLNTFRGLISSLNKRIQCIYIVRVAIRFGLLEFKKFDGKFYFEREGK
jgi:5-methylcytosine-specific restriction endonuclease McrA